MLNKTMKQQKTIHYITDYKESPKNIASTSHYVAVDDSLIAYAKRSAGKEMMATQGYIAYAPNNQEWPDE